MTDAMPLETKREKINQALRTFGTVLLEDVLPQVEKLLLPALVAYLSSLSGKSSNGN